jgi:hypothetical protein
MVSQVRGDEPDLQLGDSGEGVQELQFRLYRLGHYRDFPDGTYDMRTEDAVRDLQGTVGHDRTGTVTRETWEAIVYWEQQHALDYQYPSPSYALDQLRYDLDHPQEQSHTGHAGQLSDDGHWQWTGHEWVAAAASAAASGGAAADPYIGTFSDDGYHRWDGTAWVPATAEDHVGRLSPDGYWRWDGRDWVVA